MTLTPVDLFTCDDAIDAAHGKVITFGLGLGYFAYMAAGKPCVSSVTVIEKSPDVIGLFEKYILNQFPERDKIRIVNADAFEYAEHVMPTEHFDYAFVDTWRDSSDGAPMYKRMKPLEKLSPSTKFDYWIENFLISRLRALKLEKIAERLEKYEMSYADAVRELENII
jgi:predicted methyltransferase